MFSSSMCICIRSHCTPQSMMISAPHNNLEAFCSLEKPESLGCLSKIRHISYDLVLKKTLFLGSFRSIDLKKKMDLQKWISWGLQSISAYSFLSVCVWTDDFRSIHSPMDRRYVDTHRREGTNQLPAWCPTSFSTLRFDIWIQTSRAQRVQLKRSGVFVGGLSICIYSNIE